MKDFEKAIEISKTPVVYETDFNLDKTIELQRYNAAMLMAAWKQEQMIEKVVELLNANTITAGNELGVIYTASSYNVLKEKFIENIKKAMKGE